MFCLFEQAAFAQVLRLPSFKIEGQTAPEQVDLSKPQDEKSHGESMTRVPAKDGAAAIVATPPTPPESKSQKAKEIPLPAAISKTVEPKPLVPEEKIDDILPKPTDSDIVRQAPLKEVTPDLTSEAPLEVVIDRKDVPARTVFVDMEPVEGAASYEVQVQAKTQRWAEPYSFEIKDSKLRFRLSPGRYNLRTRSKPEEGIAGGWGEWQPFWIQFRAPTEVYPGRHAMISPKGNGREHVVFEWPAVNRAKAYSLRLYDETGKLLRKIRTVNTWQSIALDLDATYAWDLQPLSTLEEPDLPARSDRLIVFRVGTPEKELRGIAIDIPPVRRAISYQFEFVRFLSEDKTSEPTLYSSREPKFQARLEPGEYEMRVRSEFEDASFSDWSSPNRFWVQSATPKLLGPVGGKNLDPDDDLESTVHLKWEKTRNAKFYRVRVWDEDNKLVASLKTDKTEADIGVPHDKKYKWHVSSLLERENERLPAAEAMPPENTGEFKVDHYTRLNLSQTEEPSQLYAWGRYLTSIMNYQANNYDNNTILDQKVFGGIGEIAGGYWHRKTNYGVLATGALSGFTMKGKSYTYSHTSILMGYRTSTPGPTRWRLWVGPAFHQTPEILVDGATTKIHFSRIQSLGPELRGIYMRDIYGKWGMQLYASAYIGVKALDTPNGLAYKSANLYNAGVFGTYKFNQQTVGLLGYSYQVESGAYESSDPIALGPNDFEFTGHFLSATVQFGLEKPQR